MIKEGKCDRAITEQIEKVEGQITYIKGYLPVLKNGTFASWFEKEEKLAKAISDEVRDLKNLETELGILRDWAKNEEAIAPVLMKPLAMPSARLS